jgi:YggT family protein
VYTATDPPLRAIRRVIPPLRLGQVALDLSPMVLLIALWLLQGINRAIFF